MSLNSQTLRSQEDAQKLSIGVLGDGQLAQMLSEAAEDLGLNLYVFASSPDSPAAQTNTQVTLGLLDNSSDFLNFCKDKDLITIESEFIDPEQLKQTKTKVWPSPTTLECLRDRLPQKKSLIENGIATSPLYQFSSFDEARKTLKQKPLGLVFKKRLFGYDGYGTRVIKTLEDLNSFEQELLALDNSCSPSSATPPQNTHSKTSEQNSEINSQSQNTTRGSDAPSDSSLSIREWIAEDFVPFTKELAVSFARNPSGQILSFPLVESHQENSKCLWVKGPIAESPYQSSLETLKSYVNKINFVGLISFELFLTQDGTLLVNEVAPRVHNSAHYSIEALNISQFTAHLMAICNMELPQKPILQQEGFAMYNLIGERDCPASALTLPQALSPNIYLHWYKKTQSRKGRKLGHLTTLADTPEKALLELEKIRAKFQL